MGKYDKRIEIYKSIRDSLNKKEKKYNNLANHYDVLSVRKDERYLLKSMKYDLIADFFNTMSCYTTSKINTLEIKQKKRVK